MEENGSRPGDNHFRKGWKGGPGRPKGSVGGRNLVLRRLDAWLSDDPRQDKLFAELEDWLDADPRSFWKDIILRLLPKNVTVSGDDFGPSLRLAIVDMLEKHAAGEPTPPNSEGPSL